MPWGATHWKLWIRAQNFGNSAKPRYQTVSPVYLFQKIFAGSFIRAKFVWDVPLSILVSSVG